jgi:hypothetical protein
LAEIIVRISRDARMVASNGVFERGDRLFGARIHRSFAPRSLDEPLATPFRSANASAEIANLGAIRRRIGFARFVTPD